MILVKETGVNILNNNIDEYIILNKKSFPKITSFTVILFILILLILLLSNTIEYESFYDITAIYNNSKVSLLVNLNDLDNVLDNDYLILNNKKYNYYIESINEELLIDNNLNYKKINININLPKKYQINNLIINFRKRREKKKIIYYVIDLIRR